MTGDWTKGPAGTNEHDFRIQTWIDEYATAHLAESWEVPDPNTIIFHIRKGVHFGLNPENEASRLANGREFVADDIVYEVERMFGDYPGAFHPTRFGPNERPVSIEATDKYTVVVKCKPGYMTPVITSTGDWECYGPREVTEKYGDLRDWENSVGTGPFMLIDWVPGSSTSYIRNPNCWQKNPLHPEDQLPYVDTVKVLYILDASTVMAGFRTGKIDLNFRRWIFNQDDKDSLQATNPEMKFTKKIQVNVPAIHFRMDNPDLPWYDQNVRWALSMAIDREAIVRDYFGGDAEILATPAGPLLEYMGSYTPLEEQPEAVQELFKYQPEKAKQLLAEAGYPDGFKIKVDTAPQYTIDLLEVVNYYWGQVGVEMEIAMHENAAYESMESGRAIMEASWSYWPASTFYTWHYFITEDFRNIGNVYDPRGLELRPKVLSTYMREQAVAEAALKEYWPYVLEQAWVIHMPTSYDFIPYQPWLKGYSGEISAMSSGWGGPARYLWIDQEMRSEMTRGRR